MKLLSIHEFHFLYLFIMLMTTPVVVFERKFSFYLSIYRHGQALRNFIFLHSNSCICSIAKANSMKLFLLVKINELYYQ